MSVTGVTKHCRYALRDAIHTTKLKCLPYDSWTGKQGNIVTLGLPAHTVMKFEQGYGFHTVSFPVKIYQILNHNLDKCLEHQDENLEIVINRLGSNPTLDNKVAATEVSDNVSQTTWTAGNNTMFVVTDFVVSITPFIAMGE